MQKVELITVELLGVGLGGVSWGKGENGHEHDYVGNWLWDDGGCILWDDGLVIAL